MTKDAIVREECEHEVHELIRLATKSPNFDHLNWKTIDYYWCQREVTLSKEEEKITKTCSCFFFSLIVDDLDGKLILIQVEKRSSKFEKCSN